eukprot:scaffold43099_cov51-Attheya_sp.AAC.4
MMWASEIFSLVYLLWVAVELLVETSRDTGSGIRRPLPTSILQEERPVCYRHSELGSQSRKWFAGVRPMDGETRLMVAANLEDLDLIVDRPWRVRRLEIFLHSWSDFSRQTSAAKKNTTERHRRPASSKDRIAAHRRSFRWGTWALSFSRSLVARNISRHKVALKRVSKKTPPELSPSDCLRFWGLQENGVTRGLFHFTENYKGLLDGRIIVVTLTKKWITNVYTSASGGAEGVVAGEELNEHSRTGNFEGVTLQYFPLLALETDTDTDTNTGNLPDGENEQDFCGRIEQDIDTWLSSRPPPPEGHIRLWHGTSMQSMNRILHIGIDQTSFQEIADFGPGFYCSDKVRASL